MDAAPPIPAKQRRTQRRRRQRRRARERKKLHIPPEIVEEILLNLPVKSLVRFTCVCKSWNSMILEPRFGRNHKRRTVLHRRDKLVIMNNDAVYEVGTFSSLSSDDLPTNEYVVDNSGQFEEKLLHLCAYCEELWCVRIGKGSGGDLFLWNPSMRNYRRLPPPLFKHPEFPFYRYGLAYDSVGEDYKILKVGEKETELYSLRNNCWRRIDSCSPAKPSFYQEKGGEYYVGGRFHWIGFHTSSTPVIVSFNLSTERYQELALPQYKFDEGGEEIDLEVVVLRGKLCVSLNCYYLNEDKARFELWVMEEYGVEKSWTNKFDLSINSISKLVTPLYFYDNGDVLLEVYDAEKNNRNAVLYDKENAEQMKDIVSYEGGAAVHYVETLISPATLYP